MSKKPIGGRAEEIVAEECRVYQSAQFYNTNHRLVEATLKMQLKSGRMVPSQPRLMLVSSRMRG